MHQNKWVDLAIAVCDDANIAHNSIEIITTWDQKFSGSDTYRNNAVFRIGDERCLKLYGPNSERQFHVESSVLRMMDDQNSAIPAPRFIAARERSQLPAYLIMTEIEGTTMQNSWGTLSRTEQLEISRDIGIITASIHRMPQQDLTEVERRFGGRREYASVMQADRIAEIEGAKRLTIQQRTALLDFLLGEAQEFLDEPLALTHSDFSHAHIYLTRHAGRIKVAGIIDWAEAMLGPSEWDIAFHWFWTLNQDGEAMRHCLKTFFHDGKLPERFARRCLSTHLYSFSMAELWPAFAESITESEPIVRAMTSFFFPLDVFGPPD
jgi:aminoglycoside phosphotransferase (APT) family kinase protein